MDIVGSEVGWFLEQLVQVLADILWAIAEPVINWTGQGLSGLLIGLVDGLIFLIVELSRFLIESGVCFKLMFVLAGTRIVLGDTKGGMKRVQGYTVAYLVCSLIAYCLG